MADFQATTISGRQTFIQGNKRVVIGSVIVTTGATSDDTVFPGLSVIDYVTGQWSGAPTTVQIADLSVNVSTVTAGGIRITHATTMANVPIEFFAVGR